MRHQLKRKALIALLAIGTVGGFAWGVGSSLRHHRMRRASFEERVTDICSEAVKRAQEER
jgi:hypothetical protein